MILSPTSPHPGAWTSAGIIAAVVLSSTCGEVLTAAAMQSIGDLDEIRARRGLKGAIRAVVTCPMFFAGVFFLALAFFALLFALNHLDLSLVAPASASNTARPRSPVARASSRCSTSPHTAAVKAWGSTTQIASCARMASTISLKFSNDGPTTTGTPNRAGSSGLCPPEATRLPPTNATAPSE